MQASRKVRPILEQAAAAAAAATNAEGTAKAQAAAKKAKKLTPEEMKKMRQQADPNYQVKQAAAAGDPAAHADGLSKKANKGKAVSSKPKAPSETASKVPGRTGRDKIADASSKPEAATTHAAAQAASQAAADHDSASGSKRRQGLGFAEEQPQPKRAKQEFNTASPDPAASSNTGPAQHAQQAQAASDAQQQAPGRSAGAQQTKTKPALQNPAATTQAAVASSGAQGQAQSAAAAATAQGPPVVFTDECTAFVRGLDNKVTEDELKELLMGCGDIKGVRLVKDKITGWFKVGSCQLLLLAVWRHATSALPSFFECTVPQEQSV